MRDLRQYNEPVYYGAYQQQITDGNQLRDAEQRHDELRQLEVNSLFFFADSTLLFFVRVILFNCMKFIVILLNLLVVIIK
jgi:hypothetical protein